jgi:RHS repeat-associated protein
MPAQLHAKPTHALPRERSRARGCKTASKKISSFSRSRTYARCAPAHTAPRETALFMGASISGALVLRFPGQYADSETGLFYNYYRTYQPTQGRYTQADPIGLDGGWNRFGYVEANPLSWIDPEGLVGLYNDGSVNVNAYPGPPAGGNEHARAGAGQSYHVHIRDSSGREVRISTETWKPLTPQDQKIYDQSKPIRNFCDGLSPGEKKFYDRVNRQVFHKGYPTINQTLRIGGARGRTGGRSQE